MVQAPTRDPGCPHDGCWHTYGVEEGDPAESGFGYERISPEFSNLDEAQRWLAANEARLAERVDRFAVNHLIARYHNPPRKN